MPECTSCGTEEGDIRHEGLCDQCHLLWRGHVKLEDEDEARELPSKPPPFWGEV